MSANGLDGFAIPEIPADEMMVDADDAPVEAAQLPTREQFFDTDRGESLLALSDERALNIPSVRAFNARTVSKSEENCPICISDMSDLSDVVVIVKCGHIFHMMCLLTWLAPNTRKRSCPLCRRPLVFDDDVDLDADLDSDVEFDEADETPEQRAYNRLVYELDDARAELRFLRDALEHGAIRDPEVVDYLDIPEDNADKTEAETEAEIMPQLWGRIAWLEGRVRQLSEMEDTWSLEQISRYLGDWPEPDSADDNDEEDGQRDSEDDEGSDLDEEPDSDEEREIAGGFDPEIDSDEDDNSDVEWLP